MDPRVEKSMDLATKLGNIFRARGHVVSRNNLHYASDIEEVEKELGCPLPPDYVQLLETVGAKGEWGMDPMYLFSPKEILETIRGFRESFEDAEPGQELDWSEPNCYIPLGSSASAFSIGWIKTSDTYGLENDDNEEGNNKNIWPIVQLDLESDLNGQDPVPLTLCELLYRMVVRAVTPEIWEQYKTTSASYFWHSEEAAQDGDRGQTKRPRDGSKDIEDSKENKIIVFGRIVYGNNCPDSDEELENDEENDDGDDGDDAMGDDCDLPVFKGASKEDFNAFGVYNLLHPSDMADQQREANIEAATTNELKVTLSPPNLPNWFTKSFVDSQTQAHKAFLEKVKLGMAARRRIAVADRFAAVVLDDGTLATMDDSFSHDLLVPAKDAEELLAGSGDKFVEVALGDFHGVALTMNGRIVTWSKNDDVFGQCGRGDPNNEEKKTDEAGGKRYGFVSLDHVGEKLGIENIKAVKVFANSFSSAAILQDGTLVVWGNADGVRLLVPSKEGGDTISIDKNFTPTIVPGLERNIIDISFGYKGQTFFLHNNGKVSSSTRTDGLKTLELPLPAVSVCAMGDHATFVLLDGSVYGVGSQSGGQLPLMQQEATRAEAKKQIEKFKKEESEFEALVEDFRKLVIEHAKQCKLVKEMEKGNTQPTPDPEPINRRGPFLNAANAAICNGVHHSPAACDGPKVPHNLRFGPTTPRDARDILAGRGPSRGSGLGIAEYLSKPTLLVAGAEYGRELAKAATATGEAEDEEKNLSWDAVTGPYGMKPGSVAPIIDTRGNYGYTIFLHDDGSLSASGSMTNVNAGIEPTDDTPDWAKVGTDGKSGPCITAIQNVAMPLASQLEEGIKFIAMESTRAGTLAIDDKGFIWGCGRCIGFKEVAMKFEKLSIHYPQ